MENKEIIKELKQITKIKSINLPSSIIFSIVENVLKVNLKDVSGNMQEDKSAFEGWIICLKSWFPEIEKVELHWEQPYFKKDIEKYSEKEIKKDKNRELHYNRFLFRVLQFSKMYPWFSYSEGKKKNISDFENILKNKLIINYPNDIKRHSISESKKEDIIESLFVNEYKFLLKDKLLLSELNQQLPVGIFTGLKSENTRLFTGQKSAIDIWGSNGDELSIFELKYQNKKVGIISELLFYLGIMNKVFIKGTIKYPEKARDIKYRDFPKLYSKIKTITKLKGYFLVDKDKLHPLIGNDVIKLINTGLENIGNIRTQTRPSNYWRQSQ